MGARGCACSQSYARRVDHPRILEGGGGKYAPIGETVRTACACCRITSEIRIRAITEAPVCAECKTHHGDHYKTEQSHLQLWSAEAAKIDELRRRALADYRARESELREQLRRIEAENQRLKHHIVDEFNETVIGDLHRQLETAIVIDALGKRDAAFRREGELLGLFLLDIEPFHRGAKTKCSCGTSTSECREWQAIEPLREILKAWEARQLRRLGDGLRHDLPAHHPEVRRRRPRYG